MNSLKSLQNAVKIDFLLTGNPVIAIWCMESLTHFRTTNMQSNAFCSSLVQVPVSLNLIQKKNSIKIPLSPPENYTHFSKSFNSNWYFVILCTGFSKYAANGNLWPSFFWHSCKNKCVSTSVSRNLSDLGIFWQ